MRGLKRNQQSFWYALYSGETEQTDGEGNYTGEIGPVYAVPVQMDANISASRGNAETDLFGVDVQYSKVISTCDMNCPITEESAIWIGRNPEDADKNPVPHNYVVARIARSLNSILIAVQEVKITGAGVTPEPEPGPEPDPDPDQDPDPDPDPGPDDGEG